MRVSTVMVLMLLMTAMACLLTTGARAAERVDVLIKAGAFKKVWNTDQLTGDYDWYVDGHSLVVAYSGLVYIHATSHTEPVDSLHEVNCVRAQAWLNRSTSDTLWKPTSDWTQYPIGFSAQAPEAVFWAPHVVYIADTDTYYMFYGGGNEDMLSGEKYMISLATSKDTNLKTWQRHGVLFTATEAHHVRDPMVMNLGPGYDNQWCMYYSGITEDGTHTIFYRLTYDINDWSHSVAKVAFVSYNDGGAGGQFVSDDAPFVVRRGPNFYLFTGGFTASADTRVFVSTNPFDFGSFIAGTASQVGAIESHASEIVRDFQRNWYITHSGAQHGGVSLSQLSWLDGLDQQSTSLPIPNPSSFVDGNYKGNVGFSFPEPRGQTQGCGSSASREGGSDGAGMWYSDSQGMFGGCTNGDAFYRDQYVQIKPGYPYTLETNVMLTTRDGNPSRPGTGQDHRMSQVGLVWSGQPVMKGYPVMPGYGIGIFADDNGASGVIFGRWDINTTTGEYGWKALITNTTMAVNTNQWYFLKMQYMNGAYTVWFADHAMTTNANTANGASKILGEQVITKFYETTYEGGLMGIYIHQGSGAINNIYYRQL